MATEYLQAATDHGYGVYMAYTQISFIHICSYHYLA